MAAFLRDLRYAVRVLRRRPAFAATAILCLALGAAANTTLVSLADAVMLRPMPFDRPEELVMVALRTTETANGVRPFSVREFEQMRDRCGSCAEVAVRTYQPLTLRTRGTPKLVQTELVSGNYFRMLHVGPQLGRTLDRSDEQPGSSAVVISDGLWSRAFGRDPAAIGQAMHLNGVPMTIAGVAPSGFNGAMQLIGADVWIPLSRWAALVHEGEEARLDQRAQFGMIARLRTGAGAETAEAELSAAARSLTPDANTRDSRVQSQIIGATITQAAGIGLPPALRGVATRGWMLLAALILVVLTVCVANVASLALAQQAGRRGEIGVRLALGARRVDILRQLVIESILLSLIAALIGLPIVYLLTGLVSVAPQFADYLRSIIDPRPDLRVFAYSLAAAAMVGIACGLGPAMLATSRGSSALSLGAKSGGGFSNRTHRWLALLVGAQLAVSAMPLLAAGLLARSVSALEQVDVGFDTRNLVSLSFDLGSLGYQSGRWSAFWDSIASAARSTPGVVRVAIAREGVMQRGQQARMRLVAETAGRIVETQVVSAGYFECLGIAVKAGRAFTERDREASAPVVIVSESLARRAWPAANPIGQRLLLDSPSSAAAPIEVVGVVADKIARLTDAVRDGGAGDGNAVIYRPLRQVPVGHAVLLVKFDGLLAAVTQGVRQRVSEVAFDLAPTAVASVQQERDWALQGLRGSAMLFIGVCGACLVISIIGIVGMVRYTATWRTREFGIRLALGARPSQIIGLMVRGAVRAVAIGAAIGLLGALAAVRVIAGWLYGVSPHDPLTAIGALLVLILLAAIAAYLPARAVTRVSPLAALREE